jgi:S-adenosylmethionine:tRNA ribosyltransferase-isomerase
MTDRMETSLNLSDYDYNLPKELIAQSPSEQRDRSRLLVLRRDGNTIEHKIFSDIADYIRPGDCLVVNKTRVVPARIFAKKTTGGKVELLFINPLGPEPYLALVKPFQKPGTVLILPENVSAEIKGKTGIGETILEVKGDLPAALEKHGVMPLPPYIKRPPALMSKAAAEDRERYQTVYARDEGSIAAPTAGLHFSAELLERLKSKGVELAEIVLHVGWGTFRPVISGNISEHKMLPERYEISREAAGRIIEAKKAGGKVFVVGTTTARALESSAPSLQKASAPQDLSSQTGIFIYPGYNFKVVDAFVTNFHLPKSTPLFMASAFAGRENILAAYAEAVLEKYRFFSYGDAMLIL